MKIQRVIAGLALTAAVITGAWFWSSSRPAARGADSSQVPTSDTSTTAPVYVGAQTCAVTFQGRIGCFDANSGRSVWERAFSSDSGLAQDDQIVAAGDDWSVVNAFNATDGTPLWKSDKLKNRQVSVPFILGRAVVVGDYEGYVHFLDTTKGELVGRAKTDGSAITAAPVLAGDTLVVQTHDGGIYGFRPR